MANRSIRFLCLVCLVVLLVGVTAAFGGGYFTGYTTGYDDGFFANPEHAPNSAYDRGYRDGLKRREVWIEPAPAQSPSPPTPEKDLAN
jgi:hypothetical protein